MSDNNRKLLSEGKLKAIRKLLSVDVENESEPGTDPALDESRQFSTVFELAGVDQCGLLAEVNNLLKINGWVANGFRGLELGGGRL